MAADSSLGLMVDRRSPSDRRPLSSSLRMICPVEPLASNGGVSAWLVRAGDGGALPRKVESEAFGEQIRIMDKVYLPAALDPDLVATMFEVVADAYDQLADAAVNVGTARALLAAALEGTGPEPVVLDFGCGTGLAVGALDMLGVKAKLLGVDISAAMLSRASARGEAVLSISQWRHCRPIVDAAIACFVLHYGVPAQDLVQIATSLRPGGRFAANLFRPKDGDADRLSGHLKAHGMHLLASSAIGGTKMENLMLVYGRKV